MEDPGRVGVIVGIIDLLGGRAWCCCDALGVVDPLPFTFECVDGRPLTPFAPVEFSGEYAPPIKLCGSMSQSSQPMSDSGDDGRFGTGI